MPLIAVTAEERTTALASMTPELDSLLVDKEVNLEVRGTLAHLGFTKVTLFANFASSEEDFRKEMKSDLGIQSGDPIAVRLQLSAVIEAWKASRERLRAREESAAESRAAVRTRQLDQEESLSLRDMHELKLGSLKTRSLREETT